MKFNIGEFQLFNCFSMRFVRKYMPFGMGLCK